jgi:hypothetical protein
MLHLREMTRDEIETIRRLCQSRTAPARLVERARMIGLARQGLSAPAIARAVGVEARTVRLWLHRFNAAGLDGLYDAPRSGRPAKYIPAEVRDERGPWVLPAAELEHVRPELEDLRAGWTVDCSWCGASTALTVPAAVRVASRLPCCQCI